MANSSSAKKRARQAERHRARNVANRSLFRTAVRKVTRALRAQDKDAAATALKSAEAIIDTTATKGIIHKNKAARHKHRLHAALRGLG